MFKVENKETKLPAQSQHLRQVQQFEQISHIALLFLSLTLHK